MCNEFVLGKILKSIKQQEKTYSTLQKKKKKIYPS